MRNRFARCACDVDVRCWTKSSTVSIFSPKHASRDLKHEFVELKVVNESFILCDEEVEELAAAVLRDFLFQETEEMLDRRVEQWNPAVSLGHPGREPSTTWRLQPLAELIEKLGGRLLVDGQGSGETCGQHVRRVVLVERIQHSLWPQWRNLVAGAGQSRVPHFEECGHQDSHEFALGSVCSLL